MKFLFKWALRLFLLAVVLGVVLVLSKDWIIRKVAERQIAGATGLETHIGSLEVGVASPVVELRDFKLYNPAAFGGSPFIDLPELHVEYDPVALGEHKLRIKLLRLNLAEVNLVRNAAGQTNVNLLQARLQPPAKPAGSSRGMSFGQFEFEQIEVLNLTLGKFRYTDLARPTNSREVDLGVQEQIFHHLKSEQDLRGVALLLLLQNRSELLGQFLGNPAAK